MEESNKVTKDEKEVKEKPKKIKLIEIKRFLFQEYEKLKNSYTREINNYILLYIIILFCLIKSNNSFSSITLSVYVDFASDAQGNVKIYNYNSTDDLLFECAPEPDEIYLDNVKQNIKTEYVLKGPPRFLNVTLVFFDNIDVASSMFKDCTKIYSIDLSNFNSNNIRKMNSMFSGCTHLESINFENFITSSVTNFKSMFANCKSLISLNIDNFDTSLVTNMANMFSGCESLISLNLKNFNTLSVENIDSMFKDCSSLEMLILGNLATNSPTNADIFSGINYNLVICYSGSSMKNILNNYNFIKLINIDCGGSNILQRCYRQNPYTIYSKYICTMKCGNNFFRIYGNEMEGNTYFCNETYNGYYLDLNENHPFPKPCYSSCNSCYIGGNETYNNCNECLDNYTSIILNNGYLNCYNISELIIETSEIKQEIQETEIKQEIHETERKQEIQETEIKQEIYKTERKQEIQETEKKQEIHETERKQEIQETEIKQEVHETDAEQEFRKNINTLKNNFNKSEIDEGNDLNINKGNIDYTMTNTKNQKNNENGNTTIINLGGCEKKLKSRYNIPEQDSLYIIKIDIKEKEMNIPKTEYEVYYTFNNNSLTQLNLSHCKDIPIDLLIPVTLNSDLEIYNKSSKYYNDICSKATSKSGTDINLKDRRKEFVDNNMTLCEEDCNLVDYNYTNKKAKCSCLVKISIPIFDQIKFNKTKLLKSFTDIKSFTNILILKCYDTVFKLVNIKSNIGFYIHSGIILLYFITLLIFSFSGYPTLKKTIDMVINAKEQEFKYEDTKKNIEKLRISKDNNSINSHSKNIQNKNKSKKKSNKKNKSSPQKKLRQINLTSEIKDNNNKSINFLSIKKNKRKNKKGINNIPSSVNQRILTNNNNNYLYYDNNTIFDNKKNKIINQFKKVLERNDLEINSLPYEEALINDKRTFIQYYLSLLRANHLLIFAFYKNDEDYNSRIIKIFLFFFFFSVHLTVNALFFTDKTIHKIYLDEGTFNFIYQIPQIIYSALISGFINAIIKYLSLSQKIIIEIKQEKNNKNYEVKKGKLIKILKIKFTFFFIITFINLGFFIYFISCFCGIYVNTQIYLIEDTVFSFGTSFLTPFVINLIPCSLRICALRYKKKNKNCIYKLSQLLERL